MKSVKSYSPKTKILSLILSFLIVFYLVPTSIFAEGLDSNTTDSAISLSANEKKSTYTQEIYEVTELRESNVKHFRLEDGSYVAAQYNYPVHYTNENGKFIDIDNRLIESGSEFSTSNSRVKFIKKLTGNGNIFTLHDNNTKITVGLVCAEKKTNGVVTSTNNSDDDIEDALGKMTNLENISSTILYEDILDGVDIEYVVHSLNIKENIIVKERKDSYSYTFTIELNNLTATLSEDGNVYINTYDGKTKYIIPAPVVFDANEVLAPDSVSEYTLNTVGNGKYELTVTVSSDWMNAEERAFPVILDPAMLSPGGEILDLSIDSSSPNSNQNNTFGFYISSTQRAYLKFDENCFTDLPIGAAVMKAELSLKGNVIGIGSAKIGVYPITSDWDSTLTWNKTISAIPQGTFDNTPLDYTIVSRIDNRYTWNITSLYKAWMAGEANYGVGLRLLDESVSVHTCFSCYESQGTSNYRKPVIMVTYISNDGLEDYYPTAAHSAGVGGVGSINLATGRMTLAIPTLTTTDSLFAFTPTLVYNSSLAGKDVTSEHVVTPFATSYMPKGFKLNIQETIVRKSYQNDNNVTRYYYALYDADGTTHHFFSDSSDNYYDDSGLRLALTFSGNNVLITDTSNTVRTYSKINNTSWYLTSIKDKYGNELVFGGEPGKPETISVKPNGLSSIEMLCLLYEGDKLCAVYNDSSKHSVIFRYTENKLTQVQYCYGNTNTSKQNVKDACINPTNTTNVTVYATATYSYDSSGNIVRITDNDSSQSLQYVITNGKITKLSEYAGTTLGQQISYTYGEGYTDVRSTGNDETLNTTDDIITRYVFDNYGRSVSAYSYYSENEQIIGATMNTYENGGKAKNSIKESAVVYDGKATYLSTDEENYDRTLQGGIDKTAENGCYKITVFEEENPAEILYSNADMEYVVSGFGKSNSIIQNDNSKFSLSVNVYYYQGEGVEDIVVNHHFDFLDVENTWQFVSGKVDCKLATSSPSIYNVVRKIEVVYNYYGQINTNGAASYAEFKDVAFTDFSDINSYRYIYDVDTGNLVMKSSSGYKEYYEYNDKNSITRIANNKGSLYDYEYANDGTTLTREIYYNFHRQGSFPGNLLYDYPYGEDNIESKIDKTRINQTVYVYTDHGLLSRTQSYCEASVTAGIITLSYTYDETEGSKIFGALLTETDALGHITKYFYDSTNGELLAQINVDEGDGYVYDYTDWGVLEGVMPATGTASTYSEVTNAEKVDYEYDPNTNRLTQISTDSTVYSFSYDAFGNSSGVTAGNNTLATYEYYPNNGKLKKISYGNGFSEEYVYNTLEMLSEIWYTYDDGTREKTYSYTYNTDGTLAVFTNHLDGTSIEYEYDVHGRFISASETSSSDPNYRNEYEVNNYDEEGRVTKTASTINYLANSAYNPLYLGYQYTYNNDGTLKEERILSSAVPTTIVDYYYDSFNRTTKVFRRLGDFSYITNYTYYQENNNTNGLVSDVTNTINGTSTTYNYEYDSKGNITSISQGGNEVTYTYDDLGQLIREYDGKFTRNYIYDDAGNITSIKVTWYSEVQPEIMSYALNPSFPRPITETTTLTYTDSEWGDLLTSFNGTTITYDEIGNPLSYYNGNAYTFTWEGRKLVGAVKGSKTMSFTYNDEDIRTSKTVNGVKHTYYLNGTQIVAEEWGDKLLVYLYDASGSPIGMMYSTTSYAEGAFDVFWFDKNLQGDIVAVYNESGTKVATYTYSDAWGDHSVTYSNGGASTGAQYNPFRYRGYYYDTDLEMYYLQSRYYDDNVCRFINADSALYHNMLGYNLFVYCENVPVGKIDITGQYCVDIMDNDGNPFNDWMDLVGQGGGGARAGYYGPGTAYYNYQVRMGTAAYDARLGGYHSLGLSSAMINPNYYCVSGAVSVTDSMAVKGGVSSYSSKMANVRSKGKAGELMSGITKNTSRIDSLTCSAHYRIPDGLDNDRKILTEVKNYSGTLSYTAQLKDFVAWSQAEGYQMHLYTNAKLSGPLQQLVNSGTIKVFPLK